MENYQQRSGETNLLRPSLDSHRGQHAEIPNFKINPNGHVESTKVVNKIRPKIERGAMSKVNGIIVHQTGGSDAAGSLASHEKDNTNGAHFLIDKDGTIYKTYSVYKRCDHVGQLKSRCMA